MTDGQATSRRLNGQQSERDVTPRERTTEKELFEFCLRFDSTKAEAE